MAQDEWTPPAMEADPYLTPGAFGGPVAVPAAAAAAPAARAYELRPLSLGELLDRIFQIYRSRFWLFAGIACVSSVMLTAMQGLQFLLIGSTRKGVDFSPKLAGVFLGLLVFSLLYLFAYTVTHAATTYALSEVYLGQPVTAQQALGRALSKWYRYLGILIWQSFSMAWLPALIAIPAFVLISTGNTTLAVLGGFLFFLVIPAGIFGYILYLRNSLAIAASVVEGLTVRQAMRRSKVLSQGGKVKVFVIMLILVALSMAIGALQTPLTFATMFSLMRGHANVWSEAGSLLIYFICYTLVEPVLMLGVTLVYFDQRVRLEALDLVMLLGEAPPPPSPPIVASTGAGPVVGPGAGFAGQDVVYPPQASSPQPGVAVAGEPPVEAARPEADGEAGREGDAVPHA